LATFTSIFNTNVVGGQHLSLEGNSIFNTNVVGGQHLSLEGKTFIAIVGFFFIIII